MPSNWTKQPQFNTRTYFNDGVGDTIQGGQVTAVPVGVTASQGNQTIAGDRLVLGAMDALALSDVANVGTLYCGVYMYTQLDPAVAAAVIGDLAFWDPAQFSVANSLKPGPDNLYMVTTQELQAGVGPTPPIAGVFINPVAAGNFWWIQIAGKATMRYVASTSVTYTGTTVNGDYVINSGVYAAGMGTGAQNGKVTPWAAATTSAAKLGFYQNMYLGQAETAPATAGGLGIVDMPIRTYRL